MSHFVYINLHFGLYMMYNLLYIYFVWYTNMTVKPAMKWESIVEKYQEHDTIQKHILKSILEKWLDQAALENQNVHCGEEIIYTLKKSLLADLTDQELFTVAQTFVDVEAPILIQWQKESFNFQEETWKQYLHEHSAQSRESNYVSLQSKVMDRIAQYLYGAESYVSLLCK